MSRPTVSPGRSAIARTPASTPGVKETRSSAWEVMARLHGFHGNMPGSAFVATWGWYTEFCTFAVLFAGVSGVYLWTARRNERRIGLIVLGGAGAASLALMLYLTLHG